MITKKVLCNFVNQLIREEEYEPEEGCWTFRSGGSCGDCIDSAMKVTHEFGGHVMGYYSIKNPTAVIGKAYCEGHDFAFVAERFIVVYWAFRYKEIIDRPILDLANPKDRLLAQQLYDDRGSWEEVSPINREINPEKYSPGENE